jgi:hypothetical protein
VVGRAGREGEADAEVRTEARAATSRGTAGYDADGIRAGEKGMRATQRAAEER